MSEKYKALLSPIEVRSVLLKNRMIATAGIPHMLQGIENYPTEKVITHLGNRARNGAAAVHLNFFMNPNGGKSPFDDIPMRDMYDTNMKFMGHDLTDRINISKMPAHNYLCQCIDMIRYYGSVATTTPMASYTEERPPIGVGRPGETGSPGPMTFAWEDPELVLEQERNLHMTPMSQITKAQMQEYTDSFIKNGLVLRQFGFEMFSIHNAYHMGLPSQMFSTLSNDRTDEYGGDAWGRGRFFREFYGAAREAFGKDFPIEVLISAEGPGVNIRDTIELVRQLEGIVDIIHIRAGEKDPQHPVGYTSSRSVPSPNAAAAIAIKEAVRARGGKMLIACSAGLQNPDYNEWLVREKHIDIIAMSRAWICDSEYGKKLYEDRPEDINPCIRCNKCHVPNDSDKFRAMCSINPKISLEDKYQRLNEPFTVKKKVAVVGGGPAGMKAAITCAERGHEVILYEKQDRLGGQLFHADYPSFKWPLADFRDWLIAQTKKNGVTVRLNSEATVDTLREEGFDEVIVAIGPKFEKAPVPGAEKAILAIDVYGHEPELPHKIVIIGGSETATETGIYLADCGHDVTVMTRQGMISADAAHAHYVVMQRDYYLNNENFHRIRWVKQYLGITDTGVDYVNEDGQESHIDADQVILAGDAKAQPALAKQFYGVGRHTYFIGDCYRAGDVHKAITSGWATAMQI